MQETSEEFWWLVYSCSPPLRGGEHVAFQQKLELKVVEQRYCLGNRDIQEVAAPETAPLFEYLEFDFLLEDDVFAPLEAGANTST